ncbi:MAG: hypothetical protein AAGF90_22205, partial [Pseudomonadota bacterium]
TRDGVKVLRMTAIRKGEQVYRFTGVQPRGADSLGAQMDRAAASFRELSASEARNLKPYRIEVRQVRSGDTVASLAALTPFDEFREERFRVLNGLDRGEGLQVGEYVKVIRE